VGNLESRVGRIEAAIGDTSAWDLTLLTNAELIALEARLSKAAATGERVQITPELEAALERVKR
jgi:hypothetical protein